MTLGTCPRTRLGHPPARAVGTGRYYDPQTGQFLTVDPLVDQTSQAYAYANDDPVNRTDPSGQFIPFDNTTAQSDWVGNGGSYGAHPGPNVWGFNQLNGYSCLQTAVSENAPGLVQVFGDLRGPSAWAHFTSLMGTLGMGLGGGVVVALAPELTAALPSLATAGADEAGVQASLLRSQLGKTVQLLRDVASTDAQVRARALTELYRRVRIANGAAQGALLRGGTPESVAALAAARWIYTFVRGF